jgi:hypothetical protein
LTILADIGGSTILSYHLQWDAGTSGASWYDLVGFSTETTATTFTVTSGVSGGTDYKFRVRAKNLYNFGSYSPISIIRASQEPSQITVISTLNSGIDVIISWTAPFYNYETI